VRIQIEVTCETCEHLDHSGAFTPGGAQPICDHDDAAERAYPGVDFEEKELEYGRLVNAAGMTGEKQRKLAEEFPSPYHWKFRVVPNKGEPPAWCPLRKFEVKG
jgi:hypothetical protein